MKIWILLILVVLLIVWGSREGFEATQSIKSPPYSDSDKTQIFGMLKMANQQILMDKAAVKDPKETNKLKIRKIAEEYVIPAVGSFFTTVYKPATTRITNDNVRQFMSTRTSDIAAIEEELLVSYFVERFGQTGTPASKPSVSSNAPKGLSTSSTVPKPEKVDRRKQVFGPQFTSIGEGGTVAGGGGVDSSITNRYPELLGGMGNTTSSKKANIDVLPTSRVPGDMDLIPDPYRVSQTFSSANYGSKTEPLPFLTDFSAFLK